MHFSRATQRCKINLALLDFHRKPLHTTHVGCNGNTGVQFDDPIMQGAGNPPPMYDALRQWPSFVGASVAQGEHFVRLGAKQGDIAECRFKNPCALGGDVVNGSNMQPIVHGCLSSLFCFTRSCS